MTPLSPKLVPFGDGSEHSVRWVRCSCIIPQPPLFNLTSSSLNIPALAALLDPRRTALADNMEMWPSSGGTPKLKQSKCGVCQRVCEEWVDQGVKEDHWVGPGDIDARTGEYLRVFEWVAQMCNLNPKPETRNPKAVTRKTKPETRNPKPKTRNPKPETRTPKPET